VHLKMRFEIVGPEGNVLGAGRDLEELKPLAGGRHDDRLWEQARKTWEKEGLSSWSFGDLPESVAIGKDSLGLTRYAWPGLCAEGETVAVRLFSSPGEATERTRAGLLVLYQLAFSAELRQLRKDWAFPGDLAAKTFFMGSAAKASAALHDYILRELFGLHRPQSPDRARFEETVARIKGRLGLLAGEILAAVHRAATERELTRSAIARFRRMAGNNGAVLERLGLITREMEALMGPDFLDRFQGEQIRQLPRCLRALAIRAERAYAAPEKDKAKALQAFPYETSLQQMQEEARSRAGGGAVEQQEFLDEFMLMVEEFKISLFAPEVKTKMVVSKKRLDSKLEEWRQWKGN
jgi:ATP-dependent helicase HrpA